MSIFNDTETFNTFWNKFISFKPSSARLKAIKVNPDSKVIFEDAIISRNYIAHTITLGLSDNDVDQFSIEEFIANEVRPNVLNILKADYLLLDMMDQFNKDETLNINWIDKRLNWVIDIAEQ